jgi:hypothetical protein
MGTAGSASGPGKRAGGNTGTAPRADSTSGSGSESPAGPVYAGARRLAALPAAARHVWLAARLAALRSGQLTLGQMP